jgi:hypothetical protein
VVVLVVGADRLGNIDKKLRDDGAHDVIHWTGRHKSFMNKSIPKKVQRIIVFCDFINHALIGNIKKQARQNGVPVIYSKRSLSYKTDNWRKIINE